MFKAPRGTTDILPDEQGYWAHIRDTAERLARRFGYLRIETPVFEEAGLFVRSVGAGTDIVEKEMYSFADRGGDQMTLQPEGTAPVCRAYLEHGMHNLPQPVRLYYFASIFRYERPQAGRYRQHHQFGAEAIGDADPAVDAEVIRMAWDLLAGMGLKGLALSLNSIGDRACRPQYLEALRGYYRERLPQLCADCQARFERNTLRLLDCKKPACQAHTETAPKSHESLCAACAEHFGRLRSYLEALGLPYAVSHRLVRGLDYYTRTVFEIQPPEEGGQSTIAGGGRYDGLIEELGGRPTPAVGFATGIERIALNLKRQQAAVPDMPPAQAFVCYMGEAAKVEAVKLTDALRGAGVTAVLAPGGKSLKGQLRQAANIGAAYAVILGEEELRSGSAAVKRVATGEQRAVPLGEVAAAVKQA